MATLLRVIRLFAITAALGMLLAVFPATLAQADSGDDCGTAAEEKVASPPALPAPAVEVAGVQAQAGGGVVTGFDVKGTCNASNITFFQNRLDRPVIMLWKVTNRGNCELVITGPWGDIRIQREGLVDVSSSYAWIAQLNGGEAVKYSCRGGDSTATCAFTYQMEVVQVLQS